jgi:rSAM/selenodomain-associated transferase 2
MISVVIPTLNAAETLETTLAVLAPARRDGLVIEVIVSDGGSRDETQSIVEASGCVWITIAPGRGEQLARGADAAKGTWLLFLHADTILDDGWIAEVRAHVETRPGKAAVFRFAMASARFQARLIERIVRLRCRALALPYGDQGLLISKEFYDRIGGFSSLPLMEDVEIVRRIGRPRLHFMATRAMSSASRYDKSGYFFRHMRNLFCLGLYFAGVPIETVKRIYG